MSSIKVTLPNGVKTDDEVHTECELSEPTVKDLMEATKEAERLVMEPEPSLIASPTLVSIHTLRRQIVRLGTLEGPIEIGIFEKLKGSDLVVLNDAAEQLEAATAKEVAQRGRDHARPE